MILAFKAENGCKTQKRPPALIGATGGRLLTL